ncbi:DMT family transporter [Granulosicoccus antarcticus]|uniref:EamA domain-containing protein n=1 Tax=Granulosicoccus antarcticus IMCC3135 TaxID=1192854 RepID=A0A2Z2NZM9_9GAMM|nr:DMT family transporter [Granulosicoccus antarcticus]ASJ72584.1 hypothetical protein IMCC3135_12480 [Granulosicoccus antarcticus IMCC3135]
MTVASTALLIDRRKLWVGTSAACAVSLIWATWLVASRSGAQSSLTVYDLAAFRYGISAVFALPFVLYFKPWRTMSIRRMGIVTFLLSPVYILFVFSGFLYAPAAHGGIFMNGALPAITLLIGWLWLSERASGWQLLGVALIMIGAVLAVVDTTQLDIADSWIGDLMFLTGGIFFSGYLVVGRLWQVTTSQVLLCSSVLNALLYMPIWYWLLPSGIEQATEGQLVLQVLYQGLIPGLIGLLLVATAARNIGSATTAAFMASVPALGTVLSIVYLGEMPGFLGWLSLLILTPGILIVALVKR